jgi:hypothetical protein
MKMKPEEIKAKAYLESLGKYEIAYEPDGNIPPDFLLNQEIAVEVRRLNQNFIINDRYVPIEDLEYKIFQIVRALEDIKYDSFDYSILFSIKYKRPLKIDRKLLKDLKLKILDYAKTLKDEILIQINDNLIIKLIKTSQKYQKYLSLLSISDMDTGGIVHQILYDNLKISLSDKEIKVKKYLDRYKAWWLILVAHVGYYLEDYDYELLNRMPILESIFDKIIVISHFNPEDSHIINTKKASA